MKSSGLLWICAAGQECRPKVREDALVGSPRHPRKPIPISLCEATSGNTSVWAGDWPVHQMGCEDRDGEGEFDGASANGREV
jgi:hypothetical protein